MSQASERKFLHDIANPVATALLVADGLIDDLAALEPSSGRDSALARARALLAALEKARGFLKSRREVLLGEESQ